MIQLKRAYETAGKDDGERILVERLWPRGVSKEKAAVDLWLKEIAPSPDLRKWFGHDPEKWVEFRRRYWAELRRNPEAVDRLRQEIRGHSKVTFVYGAKDEQHNAAVALKEFIEKE